MSTQAERKALSYLQNGQADESLRPQCVLRQARHYYLAITWRYRSLSLSAWPVAVSTTRVVSTVGQYYAVVRYCCSNFL